MKLNKNLIFVFIVITTLVVIETLTFELGRLFSFNPTLLSSSLDDKIPFIAEFIYPYVFWYILLFAVPFILYIHSPKIFFNYATSLIIISAIALIIFIVFPTSVARPNVENVNLATKLTNLIYLLDAPSLCCLPSMHCALCFLFIIYAFLTKEMKIIYKIIITILSILIIAATLFIKQHVLYDVVAALALVIPVVILTYKFKLFKYFENFFNSLQRKFTKIKHSEN